MKIKQLSINNYLIFLLALSLYLFKGGLYLFPALLILSFFFYQNKTSQQSIEKKISLLAYTCFLFGLILVIISGFQLENILFYLRKLFYIVLIPILLVLLRPQKNHQMAILGLLTGLTISLFYAISQYIWIYLNSGYVGQSISAFWDIGRWRELLTYSVAFLIPFLFSQLDKQKFFIAILIFLSCLALVLANSRLGYFTLLIIIPFYIIIFQRRSMLKFIGTIAFTIILMSLFPNKLYDNFVNKAQSITNTQTNPSNIARLVMWQEGFSFFKYNLQHNKATALLGTGNENFEHEFKKYITESGRLEKNLEETYRQFSFKDLHNAYLNTLIKRGLLFFIVIYSLILLMLKYTIQLVSTGNLFSQSALLVLLSYLIVGMFYSNESSYQAMMFVFIWATAIAGAKQQNAKQKQTANN